MVVLSVDCYSGLGDGGEKMGFSKNLLVRKQKKKDEKAMTSSPK